MTVVPQWLALVGLGVLGLMFGSFANVVIWRFPRGESLNAPGSHCPKCGHPVRWYDNVPVLSWVLLRARCRDCGEPISWRYPAVELLSASLWVLAGLVFGVTVQTAWAVALFYLLMILSFIDLDLHRLPDPLVGLLAAIGAAGVLVAQFARVPACPLVGTAPSGWLASPLVAALFGAALGAGLSLALAAVYGLVRGKQGMGMGDVKLLGAMGLFLGPYVVLAFFAGTVIGLVPALMTSNGQGKARPQGRETTPGAGKAGPAGAVPFGPFLAVGAVLTAVWGPQVWAWYAALVGVS